MPTLEIGESVEVQGSAAKPYVIKHHSDDNYSCSCPGWRNCPGPVDTKTCKHTKPYKNSSGTAPTVGARVNGGAQVPQPLTKNPTNLEKVSEVLESSDRGNCLLAHSWEPDTDPTGWLLSEKLDGVRALWDGQNFWSRQNGVTKKSNIFHAPDWFKKGLPDFPLDGELFMERGQFQATVSVVKTENSGDRWKKISYMVFDMPDRTTPFTERLTEMLTFSELIWPSHVRVVEQNVCTGKDHLLRELERIESIDGEGLMLRKPDSLYEIGRSHTLLKVKRFFEAEARVLAYTAGKKARAGLTGALECETLETEVSIGGKSVKIPAGVKFSVGSGMSAKEWRNPPAIGSVISYRFQELTSSKPRVPRFPSFLRERNDQ